MTSNPKITELRKKLRHELVIEDEILGKVTWVLRPIPAYDLMEHIELFNQIDKDKTINVDPATMSSDDRRVLQGQIFPVMKVFLPACSVDPIITIDEKDPRIEADEALHIRDVPMNIIGLLFSKITEISGLTQAAEDRRKKEPKASLVKQ